MRGIMRCFTARLAAAGSAPVILPSPTLERAPRLPFPMATPMSAGSWALVSNMHFTQNWTAKLEYDYLALNNASYNVTVPGVGVDTFTNGGRNVQTFTVGVNYLFGMN